MTKKPNSNGIIGFFNLPEKKNHSKNQNQDVDSRKKLFQEKMQFPYKEGNQ